MLNQISLVCKVYYKYRKLITIIIIIIIIIIIMLLLLLLLLLLLYYNILYSIQPALCVVSCAIRIDPFSPLYLYCRSAESVDEFRRSLDIANIENRLQSGFEVNKIRPKSDDYSAGLHLDDELVKNSVLQLAYWGEE